MEKTHYVFTILLMYPNFSASKIKIHMYMCSSMQCSHFVTLYLIFTYGNNIINNQLCLGSPSIIIVSCERSQLIQCNNWMSI